MYFAMKIDFIQKDYTLFEKLMLNNLLKNVKKSRFF